MQSFNGSNEPVKYKGESSQVKSSDYDVGVILVKEKKKGE